MESVICCIENSFCASGIERDHAGGSEGCGDPAKLGFSGDQTEAARLLHALLDGDIADEAQYPLIVASSSSA